MLKKLEMTGYRLLDQFSADFGDLTVVIGANATGKSTLLDCLQFVADCCTFPINQVLAWHGGSASLSNAFSPSATLGWRIVFSRPKLESVWNAGPLDDKHDYVYEVAIKSDAYGQGLPVYEVLSNLEPYPGYGQPFKYLESTARRSDIYNPRAGKFVPFDTILPEQDAESQPGTSENVVRESATDRFGPTKEEASLLLAKIRFFNDYPIPSWIRLLFSSIVIYPGFEVGKGSDVRTKAAEIQPSTSLLFTGGNLGTVLHEIVTRHDYAESAESIRQALRSAYPWFVDIHAETTYGAPARVLVRVQEKGMRRAMELWDLSDGFLRFLCLASALLNPVPPPFMAFDEPEVGLHPGLLPIVADMIKMASERSQVLVATHSPDLLNCFDLDNIAVMTRSAKPGIGWHRPGNRETLRKMLESVEGDTLGDLHRSGELEAMG